MLNFLARFSKRNAPLTLDAIRKAYPTINIGQAVNVLPAYNTVFITNPKAGCSTIKLLLYKAHTGDWSLDPKNVHAEKILPSPKEIGEHNLERMLSGGAYLFTFVRDPVARAVSAYSDKIVRQAPRYAGVIQRVLGRPENPGEPVSFDDFLAALEIQPVDEMDQHWRPQHVNVMHDAIRYNRIGRLESFDADWAAIRAETGIPDIPMVHRNKQPHKAEIDAASVRLIRRIYERDCDLFGY